MSDSIEHICEVRGWPYLQIGQVMVARIGASVYEIRRLPASRVESSPLTDCQLDGLTASVRISKLEKRVEELEVVCRDFVRRRSTTT